MKINYVYTYRLKLHLSVKFIGEEEDTTIDDYYPTDKFFFEEKEKLRKEYTGVSYYNQLFKNKDNGMLSCFDEDYKQIDLYSILYGIENYEPETSSSSRSLRYQDKVEDDEIEIKKHKPFIDIVYFEIKNMLEMIDIDGQNLYQLLKMNVQTMSNEREGGRVFLKKKKKKKKRNFHLR